MKLWLHKLIDTTSMMKTSRATAELLDHLTQELGFEYYHALTVRHPGFRSSILSNAPEAWLDQYRQEHFDRIDPILDRSRELMAPFVFDLEHERKLARGPDQTFYSNADKAGIRAGLHARDGAIQRFVHPLIFHRRCNVASQIPTTACSECKRCGITPHVP